MKLKEGIKKEDFEGHTFKVKVGSEESKQIQDILRAIGFRLSNGHGYLEDYLKDDIECLLSIGIDLMFYKDFSTGVPSKSLSDLVEEEYPKYVICVDDSSSIDIDKEDLHLTLERIYSILEVKNGMFLLKDDSNHKRYYRASRFIKSTEEEYLTYQASLNPLKQADDEWDKMKAMMMEELGTIKPVAEVLQDFHKAFSTDKTFAISDDQVKFLVDKVIQYGLVDSGLMDKLKELFPAASVFKKEEKTYKLGDKFLYKNNEGTKEEEFILVKIDSGVSLVCLDDYENWKTPVEVLNFQAITENELEEIKDKEYSSYFTLIS